MNKFRFLCVLALTACVASPALAQTPAAGPYPYLLRVNRSGSTQLGSMTFTTVAKKRDINPESDWRIQEENFAADNNLGLYTNLFNIGSGTIANAGGRLTYTGGTAGAWRMLAPITCPWFTVSADIEEPLGTPATNAIVGVGIADTGTANTDKYWVEYNHVGRVIKIRKTINNSTSDLVTATLDGTPTRIYAVWNGKFLSAWTAGSCGNPNPKCWGATITSSDMDMRVTASMATRFPYLVLQADSGVTVRVNRWAHSIFGGLGCANHTPVRYIDGTPMMIGNKMFFTATVPGVSTNPGSNEWVHFHSAIFSFDTETYEIKETAKLFQISGTKIYGQHVYCPRFDPVTNLWYITHSTFGSSDDDNNVRVKYNVFSGDLLHGVHVLPDATSVGLTVSGVANDKMIYDMDFVKIGGTFYATYVTGNASTASGTTAWNVSFASGTSLGSLARYAIDSNFNAEGPKITRVGGTRVVTSKVMTTGGTVANNSYVHWNLLTGAYIGTFTADIAEGTSLKTHTPIFEIPGSNNKTRYLMACFSPDDGFKSQTGTSFNWTQGATQFQLSGSTNDGWEWPLNDYPYQTPPPRIPGLRDIPTVKPLPDSQRYSTTSSGTAYSLTASAAALDFGTTDPVVTLAEAGRYQIEADVLLQYSGATFASNRTVTLKLRRTNNTAADLTNATVTCNTDVTTTITGPMIMVHLKADDYTTAGSSDAITVFGDVSVVPSAGNLQASFAKIYARRIP